MKRKVPSKSARYVPEGIITAIVTPFNSEGELDESGMRRLVNWQIEGGIHGVVTTAGCGEFVNLNDDERKRALRVALEAADGRVPIIAGVLAATTRHAAELAKYAETAGASAVLVSTPYYINPSTEGVYQHYAVIAEKTTIPIILYNNPPRTKIDLDVSILDRLADIPTVVGLKECQRDMGLVAERIHVVGDRIAVLSGDDDITVPMYFLGGQGDIALTAQLAPEPFIEMWDALESNDWSRAFDITFNFLMPVFWSILLQNHPAPLKKAMELVGHPAGPAREPLQPPSPEVVSRMQQVIDQAKRWYSNSSKQKGT
jgi:4-hydroxy-tetrahydrodipicolinate synthase